MSTETAEYQTLSITLKMAAHPLWAMTWRTFLATIVPYLIIGLIGWGQLMLGSKTPEHFHYSQEEHTLQAFYYIKYGVIAFIFNVLVLPAYKWDFLPMDVGQPLFLLVIIILGIIAKIIIIRIVYQKHYAKFGIVPRSSTTGEMILLTYRHSFKLWWSLLWRQLLISVIIFSSYYAFVVMAVLLIYFGGIPQRLENFVFSLLLFALIITLIYAMLKICANVMQIRYRDFYMTVVLTRAIPAVTSIGCVKNSPDSLI